MLFRSGQEVLLSAWVLFGVRLEARTPFAQASECGVRLTLRVLTPPTGWKLLLCGSAMAPSFASVDRSFVGEFSGRSWSSCSGSRILAGVWSLGGDCSGGFRSDASSTVLAPHVHGLPRKSTPVPPHERHRAVSLGEPLLDSLGRPTALRARATAAAAADRGESGIDASIVDEIGRAHV